METKETRSLSEVLYKGAQRVPQIYNRFYTRDSQGRPTGACALGTIGLEAGIEVMSPAFTDTFPLLTTMIPQCPACSDIEGPWQVTAIITHLNDTHHWSRERIAFFLKELEK